MKKFFFVFIIFCFSSVVVLNNKQNSSEIVIDSNMSFEESIKDSKAPKEIIDSLVLLDVSYFSFDKKLHIGQILVHRDLKDDVLEFFETAKFVRYPLAKVIPIVKYQWSDEMSMLDNNTSAFNYRYIAGTNRLSLHARGRAIDINPFMNPVVYPDGRVEPKGAIYDIKQFATLHPSHPIVLEFKRLGWRWGGDFQSFKDYHHFDKEK